MKCKSLLVAGIAFSAITPSQLSAAPISSEEAAALLDRLNQLEQEVASLRSKLSTVETVQQTQVEQVEQVASVQKEVAAKDKTVINWKGAPEIKSEDGWSFKPRGRALFDFANLSAPDSISVPGEGFSNEARRVRLGVQGTVPGGFGYKIEADFADGVELTDALIEYKSGNLKLTVGQHNNFQSLEELSSSNDTSFIERSAFTDAFGFERKVGISAEYKAGDVLLQGGVF
ncbi:porin, partial [Parasphingorhabdus sp.]